MTYILSGGALNSTRSLTVINLSIVILGFLKEFPVQ